jgi:hypothetical protein
MPTVSRVEGGHRERNSASQTVPETYKVEVVLTRPLVVVGFAIALAVPVFWRISGMGPKSSRLTSGSWRPSTPRIPGVAVIASVMWLYPNLAGASSRSGRPIAFSCGLRRHEPWSSAWGWNLG